MYYYAIEFNATEDLAKSWGVYDYDKDGGDWHGVVCDQTFYVKTENKIETIEQMKHHLMTEFKPSSKFNCDLMNCIYPSTANEINHFIEIDGAEFESCCGVAA